jgi:uncharacterized protein (DUF302 family)
VYPVERVVESTGLSYADLVSAFERLLSRWDPSRALERRQSWSEIAAETNALAGTHGLLILHRVNHGAVTSLTGRSKPCSLYLLGHPVTAERILDIDIRASLCLPLRVALYDDGHPRDARLAYERPSSLLRTFDHPALTALGLILDHKLNGIVASIRRPDTVDAT